MTEFMKKSFSVYMYEGARQRLDRKVYNPITTTCPACNAETIVDPDKIGTARCKQCKHLLPRVKM